MENELVMAPVWDQVPQFSVLVALIGFTIAVLLVLAGFAFIIFSTEALVNRGEFRRKYIVRDEHIEFPCFNKYCIGTHAELHEKRLPESMYEIDNYIPSERSFK